MRCFARIALFQPLVACAVLRVGCGFAGFLLDSCCIPAWFLLGFCLVAGDTWLEISAWSACFVLANMAAAAEFAVTARCLFRWVRDDTLFPWLLGFCRGFAGVLPIYLLDGGITMSALSQRTGVGMRRNKSVIIGVICGLCCMVCIGMYVHQVDEQAAAARTEALARYGGDQVEVCVARRDIAAGETLDESSVETKMWVAALLPEGAVTTRADAVGKQAGASILKGEVISTKRLGLATAALEVPAGLTAVSVPARDVQAVGGALAAGMRADVYAIGSSSTSKLVSQALIVATSTSEAGVSSSSSSVSWVTLAVQPSAVEELVSAAQNLELYFVLPTSSEDTQEKEAAQ